jgi:catechol-2,3-dioxygenase
MPVHRLNHVVLYVRDVEVATRFYQDVFGFREVMGAPGRASFLQAPGSTNDHDLGLLALGDTAGASDAGRRTVGMYHVAWEVSTLDELAALRASLEERGHLVGATDHGTTKALYGLDPDGLEFEVCWIVPADQLDEATLASRARLAPLDLDREIARYGGHRRGGLGVSIPLEVHAEV